MAFGSKQNGVIAESSITRLNLPSVSPFCSSPYRKSCASAHNASSCTAASAGNTYKTRGSSAMARKNISGRLESMNASSPPHSKNKNVDNNNTNTNNSALPKNFITDHPDSRYHSWISKHRSALAFFDSIVEQAHGKQVAVFLDYDGTLSPIVNNPDHAFMSDEMRATVKDVARLFPAAIISGRCREKVYNFVQLPELYYAGSHGMDIMGPAETIEPRSPDAKGNKVVLFQPAGDLPSIIKKVCRELKEKTRVVEGVRIENNKFCASVHFRCVKEEDWVALAAHVDEVVQFYPNLCSTQGRKVLEIRPTIAWHKGKALEFLLNALGLGHHSDVFPVYIGDDQTDEDAFRVLNARRQGISIIVSSAAKNTAANFSLRDPSEVMEFLRCLVNWRVKHCQSL